jgi:alanyl-tRNA synthetase
MGEMSPSNASSIEELLADAEQVGEALLVVAEVSNSNPSLMRGLIDSGRKTSRLPVAILLATVIDDKVIFVGGLSNALVERGLSAGAWVGAAARAVGGGGGGRPDLAQAGGKDPQNLAAAIGVARDQMRSWLRDSN